MPKRPLADADLSERPARYWSFGRFALSWSIAPHGRRRAHRYPESVSLMLRQGDDRVYTTVDFTFVEAHALHAQLGDVLEARKAFVKAVEKARDRRLRDALNCVTTSRPAGAGRGRNEHCD